MRRFIGVVWDSVYNKMDISVLYGLKGVETITYYLNGPEDIYEHLIFLANLHKAKISCCNNYNLIIAMFKEHNKLDLIVDFKDPWDLSVLNKKTKGITLTKILVDSWDTYKKYFNYNEKYDKATMIAALSVTTDPKFVYNISRIEELKSEIKSLEDEL